VPLWNENGIPAWQTDYAHPCSTIYDTLVEQAKQYLVTVSIASILGTACYTFAANRLHRRRFLTTSFLLLMLLFLISGSVVSNPQRQNTFPYPATRLDLFGKVSASISSVRHSKQCAKSASPTAATDPNTTNLRYCSTSEWLTRRPPR
jgi:hypothetical protein